MIDETMLNRLTVEPECDLIEEDQNEQFAEPMTFCRVFTYPLNSSGLSIIALYAGIPFFLVVLLYPLPPAMRMAMFFPALLIKLTIFLSTLWYLTNCIRSCAGGEIHPPSLFEFSQDDSLGGWFRQFFLIGATSSVCIFPVFVIRYFIKIPNEIFWGVLATGIFLLPMCLLSIVMFDSLGALNPILIIASVFSTFFYYLPVALLFFVPILLFIWSAAMKNGSMNLFLLLLLRVVGCYLLMMDTYVLGWFFHKNEERLRWDV
jgi:hypothetical protein